MQAAKWVKQLLMAVAIVAGTVAAGEEVRRVGILYGGNEQTRGAGEVSLFEALRAKGYVEGRNLVVVRRYAGGDPKLLAEYAREIGASNPELVVTMCSPSTRAMSAASGRIPIVMGMVSDPVGQKLVSSLSRPGRNITGTANLYDEVVPKMLEVLASVTTRSARIAVLTHPANGAHQGLWEAAEGAAKTLQIRLRRYDLAGPAGTIGVLESMLKDRTEAIFVLPDDPMLSSQSRAITGFALRHRMATLYSAREFAEAGGLLAYGTSFSKGYQEVALYVDRVLRGERTQDLPIALPTQIELTINLKTARAIGVAIPEALLARAERVIE